MGVGATILLIGAAAPTSAIDAYNTQDISNRQEAPGFHWTLWPLAFRNGSISIYQRARHR